MFNPMGMLNGMKDPSAMLQNGMMDAMLRKMQAQNPRMYKEAMQMIRGKSPEQLQEMARNMAKERGVDLDSFPQQLMQMMGSK